ncbi:MAG: MmgE/PrpD family protein, partial [Thermoleophilaceae bacterium]
MGVAATPEHASAFLDWMACAVGGRDEPAARAARALGDGVGDRVAAAGTAGHVLDFDDTHAPSLAHLSAPTAPAALVLGADLGASVGDVLDAYAAGFEAMGALAAANHPGLRERGWHPTSVCGVAGAAVAAAALLDADREQAVRLALLRAGGLHAAFGSDGKALQVGLAAAAGADAARL